ncbi:para-aminobenzoate synthetase component 1 [Mucilaginibacter mallensis]|uniref:Para-aminobenzoate synthetase component 1 n=1 Tax=Mucilaginibacter mallensis TaxID=652787 RepID=A0A1H1TNA3_MUCMA|nr:anthranilate synthase component I family protein [Mucilaginibacter mallensis]SDS61795.1 para-aminobenzoate synthetase component 1 [Mucilaginibacter mallensis]
MITNTNDLQKFKQQALQWACVFDAVCYLDSNNFNDPYSKFDTLIAIGARHELIAESGNAFEALAQFRDENQGWMTGFFSYDLKNELEQLTSSNTDQLEFPGSYFFVPQYLIIIKGDKIEILADDSAYVLEQIEQQSLSFPQQYPALNLQSRFSKDEYLNAAEKIKQHISRGDIYVTNFCQEFFAEHAEIDPLATFLKLNAISPNPFGGFFKWKGNYILSASPERFLAKRGNKLISQPIKGTAKRGKTQQEDEAIKQQLRTHTKELQENVMIVDLVRNDLTKSAKPGTVKTEELFGIYSFNQLHQMISTVVCELQDGLSVIDAIRHSFPMGSMTGAPKISAMRLMEQYERSKRGVYSGAMGYFSPDNDFDFNVVIRTLLYNSTKHYLSFHTGSAITYHANAEQEYKECLLKAKAILEALGQPAAY